MSLPSYARIKMRKEGKVLRIVLSRPDKHNAFDELMLREITQAFQEASVDGTVRLIVLGAEGKNFCAGADLDWMARAGKSSYEENYEDARRLAEMIMTIFDTPKPVIARVHGGVFGGALGIVAACDIAIASDDATFALREVKVGISPATISPILLRKMGESVCRRIMLTGEKFSASDARDFGLVHGIFPREMLDDAVGSVIAEILQNSPQALASCKELMKNVPSMSLEEVKEYTARMIARLRLSEEGQDGLRAFLEKRKPRWVE